MIKPFRGLVLDLNLDPGRGSETGKIRPCVVVTNNIYNERVPVIQIVPITSWTPKKAQIITNVEIDPTKKNNLAKNQLPIVCKLAPWIISPGSKEFGENWIRRPWKRLTRP